jgi:hypothetical protein
MTTPSMDVFVYILVFIRKNCFLAKTTKFPHRDEEEENVFFARKTYPGRCRESEVPKNVMSSSCLVISVLFFSVSLATVERERFCLIKQEEDRISGVFNLRMRPLRMCVCPEQTSDDD